MRDRSCEAPSLLRVGIPVQIWKLRLSPKHVGLSTLLRAHGGPCGQGHAVHRALGLPSPAGPGPGPLGAAPRAGRFLDKRPCVRTGSKEALRPGSKHSADPGSLCRVGVAAGFGTLLSAPGLTPSCVLAGKTWPPPVPIPAHGMGLGDGSEEDQRAQPTATPPLRPLRVTAALTVSGSRSS